MNLPDHAPFQEPQRQSVAALLQTLSPQQTTWLSAFLAGTQAHQATPTSQAAAKLPVTILFGSESGNAEALADSVKKTANQKGFAPKLLSMGDATVDSLKKAENLLVLVSTWGEGDPPDHATEFYSAFMAASDLDLKGVKFSVLGLGDTSYEHFCKMGKDFDSRLESLGAKRIFNRVDCDVDYETPAQQWIDGVFAELEKLRPADTGAATTTSALPTSNLVFSKKNPFSSELKERILLNGRGSAKETLHLEFSLEGSGLSYEPGDALAMIPTNCPDVVESILEAGHFDKADTTLVSALTSDLDITGLSKSILTKYNAFAQSQEIEALLKPENKEQLQEYLYGREVVDMLSDYPVSGLSAEDFTGILRKMPPRLYSIASSLKAHPEEVHLTVAIVRYHSHGRDRKGVASTFMADRIAASDTAKVYIHGNKNFKLPTDDNTPIIMVGPGTGVAPFRAFVEERAARGASGKNWLFFGDQHYSYDFLYQTEWQDHLKDGFLNRLDIAFSRDTPQKVYVQHKMMERSKEIYAWLQEGAHFYVCGDASRMAGDVHDALIEIMKSEGGLDEENAVDYLTQLKKDRRYQRDVY